VLLFYDREIEVIKMLIDYKVKMLHVADFMPLSLILWAARGIMFSACPSVSVCVLLACLGRGFFQLACHQLLVLIFTFFLKGFHACCLSHCCVS